MSTGIFIKSAVLPKDYPDEAYPEVAILGRSNAGKSSLINAFFNTKIAFTSKTPGKTQHLNFFNYKNEYRIVDLPGYGYARRPGETVQQWQNMIESYLVSRRNLRGVLILMDVRRDWSEEERMLTKFLQIHGIPFLVVATKSDKLKFSALRQRLNSLQKQIGTVNLLAASAVSKAGLEEIKKYVFSIWVKSWQKNEFSQLSPHA